MPASAGAKRHQGTKEREAMNKVTMQDIADALGISRVTVWKVFNNYANVSAALRESVLAKAKEMGYTKGLKLPIRISDGNPYKYCKI